MPAVQPHSPVNQVARTEGCEGKLSYSGIRHSFSSGRGMKTRNVITLNQYQQLLVLNSAYTSERCKQRAKKFKCQCTCRDQPCLYLREQTSAGSRQVGAIQIRP